MNHLIINRNHMELKRLLALLFVYIGLADTTALAAHDRIGRVMRALADPATISRRLHRTILALLIPVESATRRLIVYMAATLPTPTLTPAQLKGGVPMWPLPMRGNAAQADASGDTSIDPSTGASADMPTNSTDNATADSPNDSRPRTPPPFSLVDPRPQWIWTEGNAQPFPGIATDPANGFVQVADAGLMRRIAALTAALEDLPRQALRFARWRARSAAFLTRHHRALRLGSPPGQPSRSLPRSKHRAEHHVLAETDSLARYAMTLAPAAPDTS